ncbi:hypothetical protein SprV_0401521700 [Sparganum proliferum]
MRKHSKMIIHGIFKRNRTRRNSETQRIFEYDVFLGGACNPTTWRQKQAIPFLEKAGIKFYNPQVTTWSEDLVKKEQRAKRLSRILLYVFDPTQTRGLASLVEAAFLAARGSCLVIVRPDLEQLGSLCVNGEILSQGEQNSLYEGLRMLDQLVQNRDNVFTNLQAALYRIRDLIWKVRSITENPKTSKLSWHRKPREKHLLPLPSSQVDLNVRACPYCSKKGIPRSYAVTNFEFYGRGYPIRSCCPFHALPLGSSENKFDIYLGGCAASCNAQRMAAVSYLKRSRHSYILPRHHCERISELDAVQSQCRTLLYMFSIASFDIAEQMQAAYAIGRGRPVVLLVEFFPSADEVKKVISKLKRSTSEYSSDGSVDGGPSRSCSMDLLTSEDSGKGSFDSIASLGSSPPDDRENMAFFSSAPLPPLPALSAQTSKMSVNAINDHNRCRTYLVSLAEEMQCPVACSPNTALHLALT